MPESTVPDLRTAARAAIRDVERYVTACPGCGVGKADGVHRSGCSWAAFRAALAAEATEPPDAAGPCQHCGQSVWQDGRAGIAYRHGPGRNARVSCCNGQHVATLTAGPAPDPQGADEPVDGEDALRQALAPFGWTCGPEFWQRYYSDPWVFNLANAVERLTRRAAAAGAPDEPTDDDLTERLRHASTIGGYLEAHERGDLFDLIRRASAEVERLRADNASETPAP